MANFRFGGSDRGIALNILGEVSGRVPGSFLGSWLTYGELRRLTMRGFARPRLLVHRNVAPSRNTSSNQCRRSLGCSGGKGPGSGLGAAQQMDMACE